jgi:hypothetical protein
MANLDIAQTLIKFLAQNPSLITQFLAHPYSTVDQATGQDEHLSKKDMSEVVTAAAALSSGQQFDLGTLATTAATLLGQNGDSVHALTTALFGGQQAKPAPAQPVQQAQPAQQAPALDLGSLVSIASLASAFLGAGSAPQKAKASGPKLDLSDGFGIEDVAALAGAMSGTQAAPAKQQQAGLDLGDIATIASTLLGGK